MAVELAAPVLELADTRLVHRAVAAIGEVHAPLVCLWVVQEQGHAFEMAPRPVRFDLLDLGLAAPDVVHHHGTVQFGPVAGTAERMLQAADVGIPTAEVEIEIVLPLPLRAG